MNNKKAPYFKGLTSVRFWCAFLVLIMHGSQDLMEFSLINAKGPIFNRGGVGVNFFFILSGFLLTFLGLNEIKDKGKLNIKGFFLRRVFRIFPLYYLSVFIGYILLGVIYPMMMKEKYFLHPISESLPYHLLMLPNYVIARWTENVGGLYSLWSIGVEEQFYIFFPFLLFFLSRAKHSWVIPLSITVIYWFFYNSILESEYGVFGRFIRTLRFQYMFLGMTIGTIYFLKQQNKKVIILLQKDYLKYLILVLIILLLIKENHSSNYNGYLTSLLFSLVLPFLLHSKDKILSHHLIHYLGSISFGIYIFHPYTSYFLRYLLYKSSLVYRIVANSPFIYYILLLILTIGVASISFRFYEKPFLKLKSKYKGT